MNYQWFTNPQSYNWGIGRHFTDFQSRPCISSRPTASRPIRRSILSFPEIRVSRYSVFKGCSSFSPFKKFLFFSFYPVSGGCISSALLAHVLCILAKRAVITFVLITPSIHSIRFYPSDVTGCVAGAPSEKKKKHGPWVCDISRSLSRPRPTVLLNPRPFLALIPPLSPPSSSFSFFRVPPVPRRSRFCLSLSYLASHGSQLRAPARTKEQKLQWWTPRNTNSRVKVSRSSRLSAWRSSRGMIFRASVILMIHPRIYRNSSWDNWDVDAI